MTLDDLFATVRPDDSGRAAASRPDWTVLVEPGRSEATTRGPSLRRALLQLGAGGLVVIALVALVGGLISRRVAQSQSVHEVARITDVLATSVIQPALTNRMATSTTAAARINALVHQRVLNDSLVRVKLWTPSGRVIYSDDPRLVGITFGLDPDARTALAQPQVRAEISNLSEPENRFERGQGTLLEVYRPVWTPNGQPLLFETYFRYDQVSERAGQLWRGFAGDHVEQHRGRRRAAGPARVGTGCPRTPCAPASARRCCSARWTRRSTNGGGSRRPCTTASSRSWPQRRSRSPAVLRTPQTQRRSRAGRAVARRGRRRAHQHRRHAFAAGRHLSGEPAHRRTGSRAARSR